MSDAPPSRRPATSRDVALLAGVSRSAVSRAFTPGASVAAETRARVMAAAEALRYRPDPAARSLIRQRSDLLAVVLGNLENLFLSRLVGRLLERLQAAPFRPILFQAASRGELDLGLEEAVLPYRPAAILVTGWTPSAAAVRRCALAGSPVLVINRAPPRSHPAARTGTDHLAGGRLAARALLEAGCRRVAAVIGDPAMSTHRAKLRGLRLGLRAGGGELVAVKAVPYSHAGGRQAGVDLLGVAAAARPDGLFCSGDLLAFGALDAARTDLGLHVPDEVSILGFDDVEAASWPAYALSTIRQPIEAILDDVVERLRHLERTGALPQAPRGFIPELVQRATLRGAPDRSARADAEC